MYLTKITQIINWPWSEQLWIIGIKKKKRLSDNFALKRGLVWSSGCSSLSSSIEYLNYPVVAPHPREAFNALMTQSSLSSQNRNLMNH